jgi:tetratricopeptide (TPR) repeat protein
MSETTDGERFLEEGLVVSARASVLQGRARADAYGEAIPWFEKALDAFNSQGFDSVTCRFHLGDALAERGADEKVSKDGIDSQPYSRRALNELERAIGIDDVDGRRFFGSSENRFWLKACAMRVGHLWSSQAYFLENTQGAEAAVAYLKSKLDFVNSGDFWPVPFVWNALGVLHGAAGDYPRAVKCFEKEISAWNSLDESGELLQSAKSNLESARRLESERSGRIANGDSRSSTAGKTFTGSWKLLGFLGVMTVGSLIMIGYEPGPATQSLLVWGALLGLYWWRKYK